MISKPYSLQVIAAMGLVKPRRAASGAFQCLAERTLSTPARGNLNRMHYNEALLGWMTATAKSAFGRGMQVCSLHTLRSSMTRVRPRRRSP
jgi:hypothetical protein